MAEPRTKRSRTEDKDVTPASIISRVEEAIGNKENAAEVIAHFVHKYNFDLGDLATKISDMGLNVSFSAVTYKAIAPFVGLQPARELNDVPIFPLRRARLPLEAFKDIVKDVQKAAEAYGLPKDHKNEEARSRFLSPILDGICRLFKRRVRNIPESIMPGRLATRGRIEYHYSLFQLINILFVEIKLKKESGSERLNAIAQVIAEADGCDLTNARNFLHVPILCILYDGEAFSVFRFVYGDEKPFSMGRFESTDPNVPLANTSSFRLADPYYISERAFILSLRVICDVLYQCFLSSFLGGLQALAASKQYGDLSQAIALAAEAQTMAIQAANIPSGVSKEGVRAAACKADEGMQKLLASIAAIPDNWKMESDVLTWWNEEEIESVQLI